MKPSTKTLAQSPKDNDKPTFTGLGNSQESLERYQTWLHNTKTKSQTIPAHNP
jgi:hypothetical protein